MGFGFYFWIAIANVNLHSHVPCVSRSFIPSVDNQGEGRALGQFFRRNGMVRGDNFNIRLTDDDGVRQPVPVFRVINAPEIDKDINLPFVPIIIPPKPAPSSWLNIFRIPVFLILPYQPNSIYYDSENLVI